MGKCYTEWCENDELYPSLYCKDCWEIPNSLMPKEDMMKLEKVILEKTFTKAIEQLRRDFYHETENYIFETHQNIVENIMKEALDLIIWKQRAKYRNKFEMAELRARLYEEHKEDLDKDITEQVIDEWLSRILWVYVLHKTTRHARDLNNNLIKWIYNNLHNEELRKLVNDNVLLENKKLQDTVKRQREKLNEINGMTE